MKTFFDMGRGQSRDTLLTVTTIDVADLLDAVDRLLEGEKVGEIGGIELRVNRLIPENEAWLVGGANGPVILRVER